MSEAVVEVSTEKNIIVLFPEKTPEHTSANRVPQAIENAPKEAESEEEASQYSELWENVADGIYRYRPSGTYFYRPLNPDGGRTKRSLKTKNLKIAKERYEKIKGTQGNVAESKLKAGEIIEKYGEDDYPGEDLQKRRDETKADEKRHCDKLKKFWANIRCADICEATFRKYFRWRTKPENLTYGEGRRITDRELNTLNNAFKHAKSEGTIRDNPVADRPKFQKQSSVKHCREFMPQSTDELHDSGAVFFQHPNSVVLGFQMLYEANTGLRTIEILHLGEEYFGQLTEDQKYLKVWRCKGQHSVNPYVLAHDGLRALYAAHQAWKAACYPDSKKFFPSHCGGTVEKCALAHALRNKAPRFARKLKSHGMRAFYVLVRRSQGASDAQIAHEMGHTSGGACITSTYGGVPDEWRRGEGPHMSWIPKKFAWEDLQKNGWKFEKKQDVPS